MTQNIDTSGLSLYHASNRQPIPDKMVVWLVPTGRAELWFDWDSEHGGDCSSVEAETPLADEHFDFISAYQGLVAKAVRYFFDFYNPKELILIPSLKEMTAEELKHLEQMKREQEYHLAQDETFDPDEAEVVDEREGYWLSDASDGDFDSDALASAGFGTDEDYGYFG